MYIATIVVSVLLAAILVVSAQGKLTRKQLQVEAMETVGFPVKYMGLLAAAELAGAAGLLVGLYGWPIGVAAATGVILYFIGATVSHIRAGDWHVTPAVVLLVAAAVALTLRLLSR
jgi:hypothetical protein